MKTVPAEAANEGFRPVTERIEALDPTPWFETLEERFGIPPEVFAPYLLFRSNSKLVSIVNRDLELPQRPDVRFLGTPFVYLKHRRMTTAATVRFGVHARKNVIDLLEEQVEDFVRGRSFDLAPGQDIHLDGPGYVITRFRSLILGLGRHFPAEGAIQGMVPRSWVPMFLDPEPTEKEPEAGEEP